jgi:hypothetical protein
MNSILGGTWKKSWPILKYHRNISMEIFRNITETSAKINSFQPILESFKLKVGVLTTQHTSAKNSKRSSSFRSIQFPWQD